MTHIYRIVTKAGKTSFNSDHLLTVAELESEARMFSGDTWYYIDFHGVI